MKEVIQAAKFAYAHEFISNLPNGYSTDIGAAGSLLSGGQKQRIAIARALCKKNTKLLIFDEPTSQLDPDSTKYITHMIEQLVSQNNKKAIVVVTHRIHTLKHAHKIIVFEKGSVSEIGTHQQLMDNQTSTYYRYVKDLDSQI